MIQLNVYVRIVKEYYRIKPLRMNLCERFEQDMAQTGGKIITSPRPLDSKWVVEFADHADAIVFKLKFGL